jgi:transcriptional regulator with XRE-family HTH domain
MQKSIHSPRYRAFVRLLRETRERAGVTQVELAERLGETQSFVSKCERGERRLDMVEVAEICDALGVSFKGFAVKLDGALRGA